jgi:hypothetical protein
MPPSSTDPYMAFFVSTFTVDQHYLQDQQKTRRASKQQQPKFKNKPRTTQITTTTTTTTRQFRVRSEEL